MKKTAPSVVIVGRVNVGKSTLFNRLSEKVKSLTFNEPGVTRDFLSDRISWNNVTFELIDCGGIAITKTNDPLEKKVRDVARHAVENATVALFVCDGTTGVLPEDRAISKLLFSLAKEVIVVVNKIDTQQAQNNLYEFNRLGHGTPLGISAQHGTGSGDLLDEIVARLKKLGKDTITIEESIKYRVTLLGKPNVGKSSLMNLLLKHERSIISDIAGTTREAISEPIQFYQETIQITDTPGVRRKRGVTQKLEQLMVHSAFQAIKESDIVLLLIDGSTGQISDQELKLAFYAFQEYKALILLINKSDLNTQESVADLTRETDFYNAFLRKIPQLEISCLTGQNIGKIMPLIDTVWKRYCQKFNDLDVSELFKNALAKKPLYRNGKMLIIYKVAQVKTAPITLVLFVNEAIWFGPAQVAFFENILRAKYDLKGAPVNFLIRKRYKS